MALRSVRSSRRSSISLLRVLITLAVGRIAEARIMRMVAVAMSSRYVNPACDRRSLAIACPLVLEVDGQDDVEVGRAAAPAGVRADGDGVHGDEMGQGLDALQEGDHLP